jgi:hypothetical protein
VKDPDDKKPREILWWLAPTLAGLAVYLAFVTVRRLSFQLYEKLLSAFDTLPNVVPFGDMRAVLLALSCWRQGVDVYPRNACMGGGQYNYSSFFLHVAAYLPAGPAQGTTFGVLAGVVVLAVLALLPPAQSRYELVLRIAVMGSGTLVELLESANIDSLFFAATLCGVLALCRRTAGRAIGYGVFALLAAIKFYPAVLFALLLRETRLVFWAACSTVLALGVLYAWRYGNDVIAALTVLPSGPPYNYMFGAHNLAAGLAVMFGAAQTPLILPATLALVVVALYSAWREASAYGAALFAIDEPRRLLLLAGALIMPECFFCAQNYNYRAVFFLLTLPGLCAMARLTPRLARRFNGFGLAVLFLMWEPLPRYLTAQLAVMFGSGGVGLKMIFWLFREYMWWRVCIFFAALIFAFLTARLPVLLPARQAVRS